jgi:hypothetical protein
VLFRSVKDMDEKGGTVKDIGIDSGIYKGVAEIMKQIIL